VKIGGRSLKKKPLFKILVICSENLFLKKI
jgi:hypothetical protein